MTKAYIRLVNNHCDFDVLFIFIRIKGDVSYDGNTCKHGFNLQEIKKKTSMYQLTFLEGCINHNEPPKSFIKTTN